MGIELEYETQIVVGRLTEPSDPSRSWWWQSSTKVDGGDITVAGFARTQSDAILEAAARTIDLWAYADHAPKTTPAPEPDGWGLNGARAPKRALDPERSASGSPDTPPLRR